MGKKPSAPITIILLYPLCKHARQWNISISNKQPTNDGLSKLSIYLKFTMSSEILQDVLYTWCIWRNICFFHGFPIDFPMDFPARKISMPSTIGPAWPLADGRPGGDLDEVRRLRKIIAELEAAWGDLDDPPMGPGPESSWIILGNTWEYLGDTGLGLD